MAHTVFIDGAEGTTGIEIRDRLQGRAEFELIALSDAERKDPACRKAALDFADFAILCLPDEAAREAVAMVAPDAGTRIIDASSAHRTTPGWIYGFPEIVGPGVIERATRVSNPGCYPTGFIALLAPLVRARLLPRDWPYTVNAVSGFSGGGKSLIARYEDEGDLAFRTYALSLDHKHLAEMQAKSGVNHTPVFAPSVVPAFRGMLVEVPLPIAAMRTAAAPDRLRAELARYYANSRLVTVHQGAPSELVVRNGADPSDRLDLWVLGSADGTRARLVAMYDNLGKGASGAAVQCLNLMAGTDELAGLRV
ncbi:N-acetyl-gamma-glutamyl-phosphate reductase [Erythrobacter arachoides]|uniref:N-acetyl-gamma-glutamyl-phosphate reductase n=1 Tax=Aurantiacibacter arachoides TaxID=1850444 RepID=A0A845A4E2_9SPHN|nr:N-acetyl-gamma-glutamyl-phosphate reductase [Aurantiacibacter arachoides]MXO92459.1 N-acetyl-gamma-glutamyl-phosphate reductase [Aurantiacibacter arachoides]GGD57029.1 N-acetyl-gamma-glutamyl-phosphate reductase [Aurantiacibacter arachoides]